ncbi:HEAT repeat domain-containing protein [uncultured Algoriphagus sp.]|uniref:HEAT repeat domain-containing protein n=1 Tax=uncultured Algoriphagus sp. TaxID=417365 RepID=UPI0030EB98CC|tara:strand:- start:3211 stop:7173 length:3963 start_codon:yes stop_codon:yes gene_type:complete
MRIDRSFITQELLHFSQTGNGLIIGKPGIGKSFLLGLLAEKLLEINLPVVIIKIDEFLDASDESLTFEIGGDENWISFLRKVYIPEGTKAVLLFDAFDAARDANLRNQVLLQIKKATSQLTNWSVLVSARSYDAEKSPQLQKIFGIKGTSSKFRCRNFEIKELDDKELESLFDNRPEFRKIFNDGNDSLKDILRIPFFLNLMDQIFSEKGEWGIAGIKKFRSEVELLELYWKEKVAYKENDLELEKFLTHLSNILVDNVSLVCKKHLLTENPEIFKELRSNDLITEVGKLEENVAFSHNILFDYIVGRQVISDNAEELVDFLEADNLRQFFLRPSIVYKLTFIWHKERNKFWKLFFDLKKSNKKEITLFRKLIPVTIVALQFDDWTDLEPISKDIEGIKDLLQAIRFLDTIKYEKREINLLKETSKFLDPTFIWEFSHILDRIFKKLSDYKQPEFDEIGEISRTFFHFILEKRLEKEINPKIKASLDRLGSIKGVNYICKTFSSDPIQSRALILKVLEILNEPGFDIYYFNNLCDNVKELFETDPGLASEIYLKIYGHVESSEEETSMGSPSVVLALRSTRRQDFDSCYYQLKENFPTFLQRAPFQALPTGMKIVNRYSIHRSHSQIENLIPKNNIKVGRNKYSFYSDSSYMWGDSISMHKPAQLITHIIEYLSSITVNKGFKANNPLIQLYLKECRVGLTWSKFIDYANRYPKIFKDLLFQISLNSVILTSSSTSYQIGESISKIFPLLITDKRKRLTNTILTINQDNKDYDIYIKRKMLSTIPTELLENKEAEDFLNEHGAVTNDPTFKRTSSIQPYRSREWLKDNGVDVDNLNIKRIIEKSEKLEKFNYSNHNTNPGKDEYQHLFSEADWLFEEVKRNEELEENIKYNALRDIAGFAATISKTYNKFSEGESLLLANITKTAISYLSKYDPKPGDEEDSPFSGYSPTPRREAAEALGNLIKTKEDAELISLLVKLSSDHDPIVRFKIINNLFILWDIDNESFWNIIWDRIHYETDYFNLSVLIQNICRNKVLEKSLAEVEKSLKEISDRTTEFKSRESFTQTFCSTILYLFNYHNSRVANEIIFSKIKDTYFVQGLLLVLFDYTNPKYPNNNYTTKESLFNLLGVLNEIVNRILSEFSEVNPSEITEDSRERKLIDIIDSIVQSIYFNLAINERIIKKDDLKPSDSNRRAYFQSMMPILESIVSTSEKVGFIIGHTAHYLMETLNGILIFESDQEKVSWILDIASRTVQISKDSGYNFDYHSIEEVVKLTEAILADHKELLRQQKGLSDIVSMLNVYVDSGWPQASSLLWRLDEAFR